MLCQVERFLYQTPVPPCYNVSHPQSVTRYERYNIYHYLHHSPQGPFVQVDELLTLLQKVDLDQQSSTGDLDSYC